MNKKYTHNCYLSASSHQCIVFLIIMLSPCYSQAITLGEVLDNIRGSFPGIVSLIFSMAVVAGLIFGVSAIFKFKQHKDNPTQITIGQPIALLMVAVAMLWMPFIIKVIGNTITGTSDNLGPDKKGSVLGPNFDDVIRQQ